MMIFVIAVESLGLSTGTNFQCQSSVDDGATSICVFGQAVVIGSSFVNESAGELVNKRIHKPFLACSLATGYQATAASGLWWEEVPLLLLLSWFHTIEIYGPTFQGLSFSKYGRTSAVTRRTTSGVEKFLTIQQPSSMIAWTILSVSDLSILCNTGPVVEGMLMVTMCRMKRGRNENRGRPL